MAPSTPTWDAPPAKFILGSKYQIKLIDVNQN